MRSTAQLPYSRRSMNEPQIFLVEDNSCDVFLVRRALEDRNLSCQLKVAQHGEEAMRQLKRMQAEPAGESPALILLDLNLPRVDGVQLLSYIRRNSFFDSVPVIVMTSSQSSRDRDSCLSLGANQYFEKPSDLHGYLKSGSVVAATLHSCMAGSRPAGG
jgi:CheY-like chemotaxis protein